MHLLQFLTPVSVLGQSEGPVCCRKPAHQPAPRQRKPGRGRARDPLFLPSATNAGSDKARCCGAAQRSHPLTFTCFSTHTALSLKTRLVLCHPAILPNRHYSEGDPGWRFFCGSAEGGAAVQADGRGALQGAERETVLQSAAGVHVQVCLFVHQTFCLFFFGCTFLNNPSHSESSQSQLEASSTPADPFTALLRKRSASKLPEQWEGQGHFEHPK